MDHRFLRKPTAPNRRSPLGTLLALTIAVASASDAGGQGSLPKAQAADDFSKMVLGDFELGTDRWSASGCGAVSLTTNDQQAARGKYSAIFAVDWNKATGSPNCRFSPTGRFDISNHKVIGFAAKIEQGRAPAAYLRLDERDGDQWAPYQKSWLRLGSSWATAYYDLRNDFILKRRGRDGDGFLSLEAIASVRFVLADSRHRALGKVLFDNVTLYAIPPDDYTPRTIKPRPPLPTLKSDWPGTLSPDKQFAFSYGKTADEMKRIAEIVRNFNSGPVAKNPSMQIGTLIHQAGSFYTHKVSVDLERLRLLRKALDAAGLHNVAIVAMIDGAKEDAAALAILERYHPDVVHRLAEDFAALANQADPRELAGLLFDLEPVLANWHWPFYQYLTAAGSKPVMVAASDVDPRKLPAMKLHDRFVKLPGSPQNTSARRELFGVCDAVVLMGYSTGLAIVNGKSVRTACAAPHPLGGKDQYQRVLTGVDIERQVASQQYVEFARAARKASFAKLLIAYPATATANEWESFITRVRDPKAPYDPCRPESARYIRSKNAVLSHPDGTGEKQTVRMIDWMAACLDAVRLAKKAGGSAVGPTVIWRIRGDAEKWKPLGKGNTNASPRLEVMRFPHTFEPDSPQAKYLADFSFDQPPPPADGK